VLVCKNVCQVARVFRLDAGSLPEAFSRARGARLPSVARRDLRVTTTHALRRHLCTRHLARLGDLRSTKSRETPNWVLQTSACRLQTCRPVRHRVQGELLCKICSRVGQQTIL